MTVDGLHKRYGDLVALDGVRFEVGAGELVGFLGPNGAGKTTTMRAIMGLVALDGGRVSWHGRPVDADMRQRFGYMPAERGMYQRMKVRDHLVYYATMCGRRDAAAGAVDGWLEVLGLAERADDTVQSLSSGNQQRVQLALALINDPDLLVLDEPFSGLDPIAVEMLSDVLRHQTERGVALLFSSHQLDLVADVCSSVVIVDDGVVVMSGNVAEIWAASAIRYVDIEFADRTDVGPGTEDGRNYRVQLPAGTDPGPVIAEAQTRGTVLSYSFAPPDLSEVFMTAVGAGGDARATDAGHG